MSKYVNKNYKHLNLKERSIINEGLNHNAPLKSIANTLGRSVSTISREIQKNYTVVKANTFNNEQKNICIHRKKCKIRNLCSDCKFPELKQCSHCKLCNSKCPSFDKLCPKLKRSLVCNGCDKYATCGLERYIYDFERAQKYYEILRSDSRKKSMLPQTFIDSIDGELKDSLAKGRSINDYVNTYNPPVCKATIYNWINDGNFTFNKDDYIEKRKLKTSSNYITGRPKPKNIIADRTFKDYSKYLLENDFYETVQMDTVIGSRGGKVLLTILFTKTKLLLAYLLPRKTLKCVVEAIQKLNLSLQPLGKKFNDFCPVVVLDNGVEFADPLVFELDEYGEFCSKVFYCDAYASTQKAEIERAHRELRRFLPKKTSFDNLTQEALDTILSHLNSYKLPSLKNVSPYDMFKLAYGEEILDTFRIKKIPDKEIVRNQKSILKLIDLT